MLCSKAPSTTFDKSSNTLRAPLMGNRADGKDRLKSAERLASGQNMEAELSDDEAYTKIVDWIISNSGYKADVENPEVRIKEIIQELKAGKVIFEHITEENLDYYGSITNKIDFRHNFVLVEEKGTRVTGVDGVGYYFTEDVDKTHLESIPQEVLKLASEILGIKLSKSTLKYGTPIASRSQLWKLRLSKMTDDDVRNCLSSLGKYTNSPRAAIIKKLTKLQQKRPEAIPIIREKALELLEIDEENFRDTLRPFIGDYITIRDEIRKSSIVDDTAEFYRIFDLLVAKKVVDAEPLRVIISKIASIVRGYGDFKIIYHEEKSHYEEGIWDVSYMSWISDHGTIIDQSAYYEVTPLTNLSTLKLTPVLFIDKEVDANPKGFMDALSQLKKKEGNIPIVLVRERALVDVFMNSEPMIEDSLISKLKKVAKPRNIDIGKVIFAEPESLGLKYFKWKDDDYKDDSRISKIADVPNFTCIPLTNALCEAYPGKSAIVTQKDKRSCVEISPGLE